MQIMGPISPDVKYIHKPKYLTAADSELKSFISPADFDRSLLLNILFQAEILIPDTYCFSAPVREHIVSYKAGRSLFESAVAGGVISVAFRSQDTTSFPELLKAVTKSGIRVANDDKTKLEAGIVADRLSRATMGSRSDFKPRYWPSHSVAESFAKLAEIYLSYEEVPHIGQGSDADAFSNIEGFAQAWAETKKCRINVIGKALEQTKNHAGSGLRRGEILKVIGEMLRVPDKTLDQTTYIVDLCQYASDNDRPGLNRFCRWVNYLYNLNMADQLGGIPSFPDYEPFDALIGRKAEPMSGNNCSSSSMRSLVLQVDFPHLKALLRMPPANLLAVRAELGHRYLAAVDGWQRKPDIMREQELSDALQAYAKELGKWAARERNLAMITLRAEYARELSSTQKLLDRASRLASSAAKPLKAVGPNAISAGGSVGAYLLLPLLGPSAALLNLGIKAGLVIYGLFPSRLTPEKIELVTFEAPVLSTKVELDLLPKYD